MALFKNLYLDLRFLNPFRNLKSKESKKEVNAVSQPVQNLQKTTQVQKHILLEPNNESIVSKKRELPEVSKKLLSKEIIEEVEKPKSYELPKISKPVPKINHIEQPEKIFTNKVEPVQESEKIKKLNDKETTQSFFSNLQSHILKEDAYIHSNVPKDVLYNNLFNEMKSFWHDKNYNMNKEVMDTAIKQDVSNKIMELQEMEVEWQRLSLEHEKLQDELASREIIIENKIKQLKNTFKKIHFTAHTHPDHHFVLSNGTKLRSMQELADNLADMDDSVYSSHVNNHKNDFANWANDVMNLKDLSQNMRSAKNKEHMSSLIKNWHQTT